ncbi:aquaporin-like protein, partial [Hortaea werneckii]
MLKHFVAATGEFVGTFLFLFFAFLGHQMAVDTAPNTGPGNVLSNQTVIYIAMSYGLSLLVTAWTMYRISGGLFNPALTFGMVITGTLPPMRGLVLFPTQIISGMCAAGVAAAIVPGDIQTVQTTLAPGVSVARGLFLEMFLTAELVFTVLMLAAEKSKDTFIAPIGIGLALFVAEIAGVYYTGGSLTPARSFGPCIAGANFQSYHYIYWIGPLLGALIAGGYYHFVKSFNYEEANPGQDSAGP